MKNYDRFLSGAVETNMKKIKSSVNRLVSLVFILAGAILLSCNKKDKQPPLPDATEVGALTFGCKINGESFVVSGPLSQAVGAPNKGLQYTENGSNKFVVDVRGGSSDYSLGLIFTLSSLNTPIKLNGDPANKGGVNDNRYNTSTSIYATDSVNQGTITITKYDGNILSGTFAFTAKSVEGNILSVTDGRFDLKDY